MLKAIIFDLDGTLVNTSRDIRCTLNKSLKEFGLRELSLTDTIRFVGDGAKNLVKRAVGERVELTEEVYKSFSKRYENCANEYSSLYPDEERTLNLIKGRGIELALLSNKPQRATEAVYNKFLAKFGFCIVFGQTEYYPLKPNPASTEAILQQLKVKKEECLFVGDGEADIKTARAAGLKCVSALWGFRTFEELKAAGGEIFAKDYAELYKIILTNFL